MPTKTRIIENDDEPKSTKALVSSATKVLKSNSTSSSALDNVDKTLQNNVKKMPTYLLITIIGLIALIWVGWWLSKRRQREKMEAEMEAQGGTLSAAV